MLLDMPLAQLGKECGHYSHNEFLNRMQNHTLDTLCHDFIIKNALEDEEKMLERGYLFDVKEQVWKKNGFPDTMMSISYHYMMNLEAENENITISKWDFRKEPSYVIIPLGAVIVENTSLIPEEITVVLGKNNTITWINDDDTAHTFVSDKGGSESWSTGMIKPGESSSVTFNNTGIFSYHGTPGPWISGTVTVLSPNYDEKNLPSSKNYDFQRMHMSNACTEEHSFCSGVFENGTQIMIQCDFPIHGCSPILFDNYVEAENEN
ncbi:MAG: cupredoxin domain-containing protein [Nitrosopumilus sp.]|nr:cupredoxin domain-containing protein [Nitrosopumilus sp.]